MYVYAKTEPDNLWTVGYYRPDGKWEPESDWNSPAKAADRVAFLNGLRNKPKENPPVISIGPSGIGGEYQTEIK